MLDTFDDDDDDDDDACSSSMLDVHKTLKQGHTAQNHSASVSKIYSYLANYVKFLKQ